MTIHFVCAFTPYEHSLDDRWSFVDSINIACHVSRAFTHGNRGPESEGPPRARTSGRCIHDGLEGGKLGPGASNVASDVVRRVWAQYQAAPRNGHRHGPVRPPCPHIPHIPHIPRKQFLVKQTLTSALVIRTPNYYRVFLNPFALIYNGCTDYNDYLRKLWAIARVMFKMYHEELAASTAAAAAAAALAACSLESTAGAGVGSERPQSVAAGLDSPRHSYDLKTSFVLSRLGLTQCRH